MNIIDQQILHTIAGGKFDQHKAAAKIKREVKKFVREYGDEIAKNALSAIAVATLGTTLGTVLLIE